MENRWKTMFKYLRTAKRVSLVRTLSLVTMNWTILVSYGIFAFTQSLSVWIRESEGINKPGKKQLQTRNYVCKTLYPQSYACL